MSVFWGTFTSAMRDPASEKGLKASLDTEQRRKHAECVPLEVLDVALIPAPLLPLHGLNDAIRYLSHQLGSRLVVVQHPPCLLIPPNLRE